MYTDRTWNLKVANCVSLLGISLIRFVPCDRRDLFCQLFTAVSYEGQGPIITLELMKMDSAGKAENVVRENSGRDEPSDLDVENLTHEELLEITRRTVNDIVAADRFLKVLPQDVTLDEVNSAIAVHYGQSITILVERNDGVTLSVTVPQRDSTVLDLKKRIKTTMMLYLRRHKIDTKVSWRYIWRTYSLSFNGVKLNDDRAQLHKLGIVHHSTVKFVKKLRVKTPLIND